MREGKNFNTHFWAAYGNSNLQQFEACQSPAICYVRVLPCTGVYEKYGHGKHNFTKICDYHIIVLATASKLQAISEVESDLKNALSADRRGSNLSQLFSPLSLLKLIAYLF